MSWLIDLRRADAVKQGDVILAQNDGILGPWRVTDASYQPRSEGGHDDGSMMLSLMPQQGASRGLGIMQMHNECQLVPLLVPLPEPDFGVGCLVFGQRDRAMLRWVLGQRHLDRDLRDWCAEKLSLLAGA